MRCKVSEHPQVPKKFQRKLSSIFPLVVALEFFVILREREREKITPIFTAKSNKFKSYTLICIMLCQKLILNLP